MFLNLNNIKKLKLSISLDRKIVVSKMLCFFFFIFKNTSSHYDLLTQLYVCEPHLSLYAASFRLDIRRQLNTATVFLGVLSTMHVASASILFAVDDKIYRGKHHDYCNP